MFFKEQIIDNLGRKGENMGSVLKSFSMEKTSRKSIVITGNDLHMEDLNFLVQNQSLEVEISKSAIDTVNKSREFLQKGASRLVIYGVNTGFGPMASHLLSNGKQLQLQRNLIVSHATGMGEILPDAYALSGMLIRLNTLAKGYSGVSEELLQRLKLFINHRIIPLIPEHGAVGTSGDLVQLSHIALALLGEGQVRYKGKITTAKSAMSTLSITPYKLKEKEGLALINGTSFMTGIGALVCIQAAHILQLATRLGAMSLELVHGFDDSISKEIHDLRPHEGQGIVAQHIRKYLASSKLLRKRRFFQEHTFIDKDRKIKESVQEVYSLRCIPQILGPVLDTLSRTEHVIEIEMNSVTDNPIVDWKNNMFLHGGNFHGDYIASSLDQLKASIVKLTMLSERRINFFLNQDVNKSFPPFLNLNTPGITLGLQGLQFVATSTTARSQSLAFPHHIHSIPTNGDNQDVVSMGTDAALLAAAVNDQAYIVLAIEILALCQAVDYLKEFSKLSRSSKELYEKVRTIIPSLKKDEVLADMLPKLLDVIKHI